MTAPLRPLPRLKQLAREINVTVPTLARVIGRSETYFRKRWNADTYLLDLPGEEIETLARFFGVPASELGG
ncbi:hypothetical protein SAMN06297144_1434 [Sphingomonas guangdongensis]|uniref:Cro/C1-type HTH DNA-binding domain-containing protein n=2 Tax=Sphingomonas guangdongensis TaxID=1141890 RepID=A0A285QGU2_9SPHN|nr:hypothetical protein SAMN06297144_1434 [Sphingomonas guangdongensis]